MLEKVTHIEGLDGHYESTDMPNDTDPTITQIRFTAKAEEMPFLTAKEGRLVEKNYIWITKIFDLGKSELSRRVRDTVEYDEESKKWKIRKLVHNSDIKQYPEEWNAFMRGIQDQIIGTPLSVLFRGDPARLNMYKFRHIETVEQLSACGEGEIGGLGMGAREDVRRAQSYITRAKEQAPQLEMKHALDQKDQQIGALQSQLTDLSSKLTQLLEARNDVPKKPRGRPKKVTLEEALEEGVQ